ncbi:MAG: DNA/RNA nuclease SfsA [Thermodesulfobacteriota bacterium]
MENLESKLLLFDEIIPARFLTRPNRFLIRCELNGRTLSAFLPNPGRLQELLLPGRVVHLVKEEVSKCRKTRYTAVAVNRDGYPIMLHTLRNNEVARYLLQKGKVPGLEKARFLKSEVQVGRSRFDFLLNEKGKEVLLEVKSCTLVGERVAMFPDAVTERGTRHLKELAKLSAEGMKTVVLFIVHWPFACVFMPDYHTDLDFSYTLLRIHDKVKVIPISVNWNRDLALSPTVSLLRIPWNYIEREARDRGSYLLVLNLKRDRKIDVGKLGQVSFRKGFYIYVGSAMANLSKRMERHRRVKKRHHWHIDELREAAEFCSVLAIRSSDRLECEIAKALSRIAEWSIPGFGSTDCFCDTHLFGMENNPFHSEHFHKLLQYFRMDRYSENQA